MNKNLVGNIKKVVVNVYKADRKMNKGGDKGAGKGIALPNKLNRFKSIPAPKFNFVWGHRSSQIIKFHKSQK